MYLLFDLVIPVPQFLYRYNCRHRTDIHTTLSITSFTVAKQLRKKYLKDPSIEIQSNKLWYVFLIKYTVQGGVTLQSNTERYPGYIVKNKKNEKLCVLNATLCAWMEEI